MIETSKMNRAKVKNKAALLNESRAYSIHSKYWWKSDYIDFLVKIVIDWNSCKISLQNCPWRSSLVSVLLLEVFLFICLVDPENSVGFIQVFLSFRQNYLYFFVLLLLVEELGSAFCASLVERLGLLALTVWLSEVNLDFEVEIELSGGAQVVGRKLIKPGINFSNLYLKILVLWNKGCVEIETSNHIRPYFGIVFNLQNIVSCKKHFFIEIPGSLGAPSVRNIHDAALLGGE